ncbi:MAG: TetR/AcrR family transcriptional regulator [Alphaproteobacteria bacterium]
MARPKASPPPPAPAPAAAQGEQVRWRRRARQRPDEILDAALAAFLARGFDAARMEDIAARAGISKAGVYLYFDSKIALLQALIDREVKPIARRAEALMRVGHADPAATLRQLATFARRILTQPRLVEVPRLVLSLAGRFPEIAERYRREVVERALGALKGLIAAGVRQGVFRAADPDVTARQMIGPLLLEGLWLHVLGGPLLSPDPDAAAERQIDLLLNGLKARTAS